MLYLDYLSYHNRFSHISIIEKLALGLGGLLLFLALPLLAVFAEAFSGGAQAFFAALSDPEAL